MRKGVKGAVVAFAVAKGDMTVQKQFYPFLIRKALL